jgi:hypothetical protein
MRFRPCRDVSAKLNSPRLGPPHRGLFVVRPGIQEVAHIVTEAFNLFATAVAKVTRALWGPSSSLRSVSVPAALWAHVCKSQVILDIYLFDFRKGSSSTIWEPGRALPVNSYDRKYRTWSGASASGQVRVCWIRSLSQWPSEAQFVTIRIGQVEEPLAPFGIARCRVWSITGRDHALKEAVDVGMVEDDTSPPRPLSLRGLCDKIEKAGSSPKACKRRVITTVNDLKS